MKSSKIKEKTFAFMMMLLLKENITIMMLFCIMNVLKPKFSQNFSTNRTNMHKTVFVFLPKVVECNMMS